MAVKTALVGLGSMGSVHLKALLEMNEAELLAVCDLDPAKLSGSFEAVAGNIDEAGGSIDLEGVERFASLEELLEGCDAEVIDLAVPTYEHAPLALRALEAGRHVFCEKPMALNVEQCREMSAAADAAGRFLMVGHVLRFWPEYLMIREAVQSGRYGKVRSAVFRRTGGAPRWTSGTSWFLDTGLSGHAALDLHIHDVDTIQWLFGPPSRVASQGVIEDDGGVSHIVTEYTLEDVPMVVAEGGWFDPGFPFSMSAMVIFESGTIYYNSADTPTLMIYDAEGTSQPAVEARNAYAEEIRYFLECVRDGQPPQTLTPAEAARAVEIVQAEIRSVHQGRPVDL